MRASPNALAPQSQPGTKRKRLQHRTASSATDSSHQQSIQRSLSSHSTPDPISPSGGSKPRLSQRPRIESTPPTTPSPPRNGMYSFPSRQPSNGVVDLTNSPPRNGVPARRLSGAAPVRSALNPHMGARKLVVKNLKKQSDWDSEEYFNSTWKRLDDSLSAVFAGKHDGLSLEDLYRCVENLCRQGKGSTVNSRLDERLVKHLKLTVLPQLQRKASSKDVSLLKAVLAAWSAWTAQVVSVLRE